MGDIDGDGFDDAAISAPYSYDGAGAVYIYRGFSNGLVPDFYQVGHMMWQSWSCDY